MLDDFFFRAVLGGIGVALVAGPLRRRLAYFGDTLSHSALLGIALALLFDINITLAVFGISIGISLFLMFSSGSRQPVIRCLAGDAFPFHSGHWSGGAGLYDMGKGGSDGVPFGDILAITPLDLAIIWGGGIGVLAVVFIIWRSLFAATVSYEIATAEGTSPDHANFIFMIMMAGVIAISMKIVGVLLITALLIIPAATARRFSTSPEQMALLSSLIGLVSVWAGLMGSLEWDIPAGPSIVVAALVCFVLSVISLPKRKITLK